MTYMHLIRVLFLIEGPRFVKDTRSGAIAIEALKSILDQKSKPLTDQLEGLTASVEFNYY
jgi:hypothetical protein